MENENSFINSMLEYTTTENGAITHTSSGNKLTDFFFLGGALRNREEKEIIDIFEMSFLEDKEKTLKLLFYFRDIRKGQGERRMFKIILTYLAKNIPEWFIKNLNLIQEYGRFDDFSFVLLNGDIAYDVKYKIMEHLSLVYNNDLKLLNNKETKNNITLIGKWLWSENASSNDTKKLAKMLISSKLFGTAKEYRKNLVKLRRQINIVETNITNKTYNNINYEQVPSLAMLKYRNAFKKNDETRFNEYTNKVISGEKKINTSTLYPYDIVRGYIGNGNTTKELDNILEEQWKNLPDYVSEINGLVVNDTSGSMSGLPLQIGNSLAIYIAERNKSEVWKNYVIPFSSKARLLKIQGETLKEKLDSIYTGDCSDTNLQDVFDLILAVSAKEKVKKDDMPKSLIIISDMEFNSTGNNNTNFEEIKEKYKKCGYELPKIVWWNVNSHQNQCPVKKDEFGNILLSGSSPVLMKIAMNVDSTNEIIDAIINNERYQNIIFTSGI